MKLPFAVIAHVSPARSPKQTPVLVLLGAFLAAVVPAALPASAQTIQVSKENRTIAVTATDKVIALADTATVHVGFIDYGPDSAAAYATGSKISNSIMNALSGAGIPKDAIESENQNVSPVQPYQVEKLDAAERARRQFQVTQSWTVRVPAADAAKTLDIAVKAGADQSGQIDWSFKDENAPQAEAAAKALKRARDQAEQMAQSLNAKLGALLYASNEVQATPVRPLMRAMAAAPMAEQKVEPLAINPRQIEKNATVYAVFAIE
ncbi:SIMPL domain-containing protein [Edaphobacter sp.]|uniref:SIMPL domain-containing protein n=1 Tax=Edaphobacter sp. TaxID=1934404 RepID=UPI002DC01FF6|nr:SIMPL domain-containing protein [Edaphobacter sp.]HEU5342084.1 SIMPL domain-containing protein [Edaphobacter sp.]